VLRDASDYSTRVWTDRLPAKYREIGPHIVELDPKDVGAINVAGMSGSSPRPDMALAEGWEPRYWGVVPGSAVSTRLRPWSFAW
jgi:hypothetical protein